MSQPRQLLKLQNIDTALDQHKARLAEIEVILSDNEALHLAQQVAEDAENAYLDAQRELKRAEQDVSAQEDKIENNQKVLYSGTVTNSKELEDLQNEAAALKRYLNTLEERQLEAMLAFEEAEETQQAMQTALQEAKNNAASQNSSLNAEFGNLTASIEALTQERPEITAPIENEHIITYDKLREKRAGLAVVAISGGECPACGNTLTLAQAQEAKSPSSVTRCDTCKRILVPG